MVEFTATIRKFASNGEKTGWTYFDIPEAIAAQLKPGVRKAYRVKGKMDSYQFEDLALSPMGEGNFILTVNQKARKEIRKVVGDTIRVQLEVDERPMQLPPELVACLADEPEAAEYFYSLPPGHQRYFINWLNEAKTDTTKTKRLALAIDACYRKWDFGQMIRSQKKVE
jgi:hypothetical protein